MDIERVQPPQGLKVERTGSEQQRRRRRELQEAFDELLESTLTDEQNGDQQSPAQGEPQQGPDTVSISNGLPLPTLVNDYVSISRIGRAGKEAGPPRRETSGHPEKPASPVPNDATPPASDAKDQDEPAAQAPAADDDQQQPPGIDTLA